MKATPLLTRIFAWGFALGAATLTSEVHADRPAPLSAQTLKAPKGPSALRGLGESFSANPATGTGSTSVPISLPPGLVAPMLALNYVGGSGRAELGVGFTLP
ncbi:MAG TPA: hypothetical protein VFQ61_20985, partial [Polyangiaceae bacterium]|nr:hypothetical protein [Polyangiaceae bacterium]